MEFVEEKQEIVILRAKIKDLESEYNDYRRNYNELSKKMYLCESRKKDLIKKIKNLDDIIESKNIYANVLCIEGFETLIQSELIAISTGMDKTDYRKYGDYPRWIDLENIVNEVIEFKKQYSGWILERIEKRGQYDTMPPRSFYIFTYKSPQGHFMSNDGINVNLNQKN